MVTQCETQFTLARKVCRWRARHRQNGRNWRSDGRQVAGHVWTGSVWRPATADCAGAGPDGRRFGKFNNVQLLTVTAPSVIISACWMKWKRYVFMQDETDVHFKGHLYLIFHPFVEMIVLKTCFQVQSLNYINLVPIHILFNSWNRNPWKQNACWWEKINA